MWDIVDWLSQHWDWWIAFGLAGQALFGGRFIYQWIVSEKAGRSVVPTGFWYLSIVGGLITFIYALHLKDPVFIVGQSAGMAIYLRNLYFIRRTRATAADA